MSDDNGDNDKTFDIVNKDNFNIVDNVQDDHDKISRFVRMHTNHAF